MTKHEGRKLDLLQDCNDQGMPPREFMATFCKRCRNGACVNSGWSESLWTDRMATQVTRLLTNPKFADPKDPAFREIHNLAFREIQAPLVIGGDPWASPMIHLTSPDSNTTRNATVEQAISALAEARGKHPPRAIEASEPVSPAELLGDAQAPVPPPSQASPAQEAPVTPTAPQANPKFFQSPAPSGPREANTAFPSEGVMLDGSPPPTPGVPAPEPSIDPWAPPKEKRVSVGAKVRMGK